MKERPRHGRPGSALGPTRVRFPPEGRRVTQETVDRMAEFRRQGVTFRDIAARLGCSERTVRRYAGNVQRQLILPPVRASEDPAARRERLAEWFSWTMEHAWDRWPSVAFIDEAIRVFGERVAAMRPETLRLVVRNRRMMVQLFREVVGPLYTDYATFEQVVQVFEQLPDHRSMFWHPHGEWVQGTDDEAQDP